MVLERPRRGLAVSAEELVDKLWNIGTKKVISVQTAWKIIGQEVTWSNELVLLNHMTPDIQLYENCGQSLGNIWIVIP